MSTQVRLRSHMFLNFNSANSYHLRVLTNQKLNLSHTGLVYRLFRAFLALNCLGQLVLVCGFKKEKKLFNSASGFLFDNLYKFVYKIHLPSSGKPESFSLTALRILCL